MSGPLVSVVIPTLEGGESLRRTLEALARRTRVDFETVVVDNSGRGTTRQDCEGFAVRVIENRENVGFGAAINQGAEGASSRYVAALNDDARPEPEWLERLVAALENDPAAGMAASAIVLASDASRLDSAGLGLYPDGTAKQRGHGRPSVDYAECGEALLPSGCAALYRRRMLDEIGWFDAEYFLYGEDTDVGLRGQWAGWRCLYVATARVEHDYSKSAGRASRLKAFHVERNRLWTVLKCFPLRAWPLVPVYSFWRYLLHAWEALRGRGLAAEYGKGGENPLSLVLLVWSAHWRTLTALPNLLRKRRRMARTRRIGAAEMVGRMRRFRMSAAEVTRQ